MKDIARKWYKRLELSEFYEKAFDYLLDHTNIEYIIDQANPLQYLVEKKDIGSNLVYILVKCEKMQEMYEKRGIPDKYLQAALSEIAREVLDCHKNIGKLGIYEITWFDCFVKGTMLFRLGRLNFMLETAGDWCTGENVCAGDKIVSVHIPGEEKLYEEDCYQAFLEAEYFIMQYFPEHDFQYFICHSWLLDGMYEEFLKDNSNISKFRRMFKPYRRDEADSVIKFAFGKAVTRANIDEYQCRNSFQEKLKKYILEGGKLYVTCGTRTREYK